MGFFSRKKQTIDYDACFKEKYKKINQLMMQSQQELDYVIKQSLLELVVDKYDELLILISQGAHFDKEHFQLLQDSAKVELEKIRAVNQGV